MEPDSSDPAVALAATDLPLQLRVKEIEDERAPKGMSCIGSFLGPKQIARCVVPRDAAAFLLDKGLFAQPVRLALAAREASPGLQCQLFALVELPGDFFAGTAEDEDIDNDNEAPWADSLPGTSYDRAVRYTPPGGGESEEEQDEETTEAEPQAAVFLGEIVRFERDRKHPEDLALEALDVLRTIVHGEVSEVVDKVLEDLLGGAGPV
jgi:hypothetical protein